MEHTQTFPRPRAVSLPEAFSRLNQEQALRQAMRYLSVEARPGPVSYPLGFAMGIFAAHLGHVSGQVLHLGLPPLLVAGLATLLIVAGCLALWRRKDRWVLYLAAIGASAGLAIAPWIVGLGAVEALAAGFLPG